MESEIEAAIIALDRINEDLERAFKYGKSLESKCGFDPHLEAAILTLKRLRDDVLKAKEYFLVLQSKKRGRSGDSGRNEMILAGSNGSKLDSDSRRKKFITSIESTKWVENGTGNKLQFVDEFLRLLKARTGEGESTFEFVECLKAIFLHYHARREPQSAEGGPTHLALSVRSNKRKSSHEFHESHRKKHRIGYEQSGPEGTDNIHKRKWPETLIRKNNDLHDQKRLRTLVGHLPNKLKPEHKDALIKF